MTTGPRGLPLDAAAVLPVLRRVATLEPGVFAEVAGQPSLTAPATVIPAVCAFAAALGATLFNGLLYPETASLVGLLLRQLVLGTVAGWLAWAVWVQVTTVLLQRGGVEVERDRLVRALGFAVVPYALLLFLWVPDLAQGNQFALGDLSAALLAAVLVIVPLWVRTAIREVVPVASERLVTTTCLGGFLAAFVLLTLLGSWAGVAPGYTIFLDGARFL